MKFRSYRQRLIYEAMQGGAIVGNEAFMDIMWPESDPPDWSLGVIRVELHRLRQTLAPEGLSVVNVHGQGWRLEAGRGVGLA